MIYIFIIFSMLSIILNIFDVILTNKIIQNNGIELNPIICLSQKLLKKYWYIPKYVLLIIALNCAFLCFQSNALLGIITIIVYDIMYLFVVKFNYNQIKTEM